MKFSALLEINSNEKLVEYILAQEIKTRETARLEKYLQPAVFPADKQTTWLDVNYHNFK